MSTALRIRVLGGLAVTTVLVAALASAYLTQPSAAAPPANSRPSPTRLS